MLFFLGLADIMASAIFLGKILHIDVPILMVLFFASYLFLKGLFFVLISFDAGSFIDMAAGIVLAITFFFQISPILFGIFAVFLAAKGIVSLLT
jgi:hypothetical protein